MRLKKIRLAGFKSFVDPTNIPFPGNMTAIVGPNGCGKSNIIDAVRWVLGESSAKNLRGDAMTDVIFNGSSSRKPVSQCSVELVFDNTSGRIGGELAAYAEISVKRVVSKDAVSSYYLNASKCRRRDITDLFLGTGLGPRSYAIIEQGMISRLIESKPQELRVFIEEAAGISKYKERRRETQTRIKHTNENLERLLDVRQALGEHIAKLQRQATAANSYKALKKQERTLKAELATIKWLAQNHIITEAQSQIGKLQQQLFDLVAGQQGEQSQLQVLKNQQSIDKHDVDDLQQQIFAIGSEVTKVEQSQIFAKKRAEQIQTEIKQITQNESSLHAAVKGLLDEMVNLEEKQILLQPEKEIIQEQLFELDDKKFDIDEDLAAQARLSKEKEDAFYSQTQLLQQKQSQIQQTISLQQRSQARLQELSEELIDLTNTQHIHDIADLSEQRNQLNLLLSEQKNQQLSCKEQFKQAQANYQQALALCEKKRNAVAHVSAKLEALESLQLDLQDNTESNISKDEQSLLDSVLAPLHKKAIWEFFKIAQGNENLLHIALKEIESAWIIDASLSASDTLHWPQKLWLNVQRSLLFKQSFTRHKEPGTLASLLINDEIPQLFNHYYIAEDDKHALMLLPSLGNNDKVLTHNGSVFSTDTFIKHQQGDNKIARAAQIDILRQQLMKEQLSNTDAIESAQQLSDISKEIQQSLNNASLVIGQNEQKQQATEITYQNALFQEQQSEQRSEKLKTDIAQYKVRIEQENMSIEVLNDEVDQLSEEVTLLEESKILALQETESLRTQQQQWQAQHSQMQSTLHEKSMAIQQLRNTLQILQEQQRSKQAQINDNKDKLSLLQLEASDLLLPQDKQQQKLQSLLSQQQELRDLRAQKSEALNQVEESIASIEKGQHGVLSTIDALKAQIESQRIRCESATVRASSFTEQLAELDQALKNVLDTLPPDANEKLWQSELEKISSSITRLGAVNLAAVAEYEEQSKRKEHLDAQSLDLTQSLEILESAMRKIDKETRTRFKTTFDSVNNDLKSLFPKVFGGGMAYLVLNSDDMLDTGVTIMAQPPGKKNSTIGLLSGGEKALTALSLVFAIFRLNPAPFCLLDEVDAPLDDANVGRFCRLVSQMSASVQFIYITHNKVAMEMATHLTGVTMAEPGVSRMVAVDMEQALAIAE